MDWTVPDENEKWDVIFGSDVIYVREDVNSLIDFLKLSLKPGGKIYLTLSPLVRGKDFFEKSADYFLIEKKGLVLRSEEAKISTFLVYAQLKIVLTE